MGQWTLGDDCRRFTEFYNLLASFVPGLWMLNTRTLQVPASFISLSGFKVFIEKADGVWERQVAYSTGSYSVLILFLPSFDT